MLDKIALFSISWILLSGSVLASEAGEDWLQVANTDQSEWLGKKGSGTVANLGDKKSNAYSYVVQISNKKEKTYQYSKVVVDLSSCKKGYGYVYYNTMDGTFTGKDRFVRFGPTVADALGGMACHSWDLGTGKPSLVNKGDTWEVVAEAAETGNKYSIKTDAIRKSNYNNKPAVFALYSYQQVKKDKTSYGEYVVELASCQRGYGVAYELDFDGKLVDKTDVVLNGNSVLSATVSEICKKI